VTDRPLPPLPPLPPGPPIPGGPWGPRHDGPGPVLLGVVAVTATALATQATAVEQARAVAEVAAAIQVAQQCPRDIRRAWAEMQEACGRVCQAHGVALMGHPGYRSIRALRTAGTVPA